MTSSRAPRRLIPLVALAGALVVAGPAGADSRTPQQLLGSLKQDLAKVRSYHLAGTIVDADGTLKVSGDFQANGTGRMRFAHGAQKFRLLAIKKTGYVRGNTAFWKSAGGKDATSDVVKLLANRWVKMPAAQSAQLTAVVQPFAPKHLAACATGGNGTLTLGGTTTIGGRPAIEIKDAGDAPGASPGSLFVTATGPVLPLRIHATGPEQPGGPQRPECGDDNSPDTTKSTDIRFSRFNAKLHLKRPASFLDLGKLQADSADGATRA